MLIVLFCCCVFLTFAEFLSGAAPAAVVCWSLVPQQSYSSVSNTTQMRQERLSRLSSDIFLRLSLLLILLNIIRIHLCTGINVLWVESVKKKSISIQIGCQWMKIFIIIYLLFGLSGRGLGWGCIPISCCCVDQLVWIPVGQCAWLLRD